MAARRSLARGIPALRIVSPRTGFSTKSVVAGTWTTSKSAGVSPLSQFHNSRRHIHITARRSSQQYGTQSAASTTTEYPTSHEQITSPIDTTNFINNEFVASKATDWIDLHDPATNNLVTRVPQSTDEELKAAVASAEKAFPEWRATSIIARQEIMFKFVSLIRRDWDRLAASITLEQGKTFADAKGDVLRGLQVAETACGITSQITGDILEVAKDMETRSYREPLGVVAAICPFSEYSIGKCSSSQANCV
jgi:malonate-semialdehyde dehydrogenase (acetylating)/methylmalonate-semialdehyde dehydrogenase